LGIVVVVAGVLVIIKGRIFFVNVVGVTVVRTDDRCGHWVVLSTLGWMVGFQVVSMSNGLFMAFTVVRKRILADETRVNQGTILFSVLNLDCQCEQLV